MVGRYRLLVFCASASVFSCSILIVIIACEREDYAFISGSYNEGMNILVEETTLGLLLQFPICKVLHLIHIAHSANVVLCKIIDIEDM